MSWEQFCWVYFGGCCSQALSTMASYHMTRGLVPATQLLTGVFLWPAFWLYVLVLPFFRRGESPLSFDWDEDD